MSMKILNFPVRLQEILAYLLNLDSKLGNFAATLGITPAELDMVHQDRENFEYIYNYAGQLKADYEAFQSYKKAMFTGAEGPLPEAPSFTSVSLPGPGAAGIIARQKRFKAKIMSSDGFTPQIGEALEMIKPSPVPPSPDDLKPLVTGHAMPDGRVEFRCSKLGQDAIRLESKLPNVEGWSVAQESTMAKFSMTLPEQFRAQPVQMLFRARLLRKNQPVGEYSPVISVITNP
jgi:hypothetical protein